MFPVLLTVEVAYSYDLVSSGASVDCDTNFVCSIECEGPGGAVGLSYQMDVMEREGLTGVFFVDPMPSLIWGPDAVRRVVEPILTRGHEVQLLLHTEWLELAANNPLGDRTGRTLADLSYEDQALLIEYAAGQLVAAGAPWPIAFRAGNLGANDNTLRALARRGILTDSSFAHGLVDKDCAISLPSDAHFPLFHEGVLEMPVAALAMRNGGLRQARLSELSLHEIKAALAHAQAEDWATFVLAWQCPDMSAADVHAENRKATRRFEQMCEWLGREHDVRAAGFADRELNTRLARSVQGCPSIVPVQNAIRGVIRKSEHAIASLLHR